MTRLPPMEIVSLEDAEKADFVVCCRVGEAPAFLSATNVRGSCHDCGTAIEFRPTAPKKPPRLCIRCATHRGDGGTA